MLFPTSILFLGLFLAQPVVADEVIPCWLCPGGGTAKFPTNPLPNTNYTCAHLALFASFLEPDECDFVSDGLDVPYYCGCPETEAPNVCTLCGENAVFADRMLPSEFEDTTCGQFAKIVDAVNNETTCQDFEGFRAFCCQSDEPPTCSICENGQDMGKPSREVPFLEGMTCEGFDTLLSMVPEEECTSEKDLLTGFELDAYCGCPDTTAPNVCSLCGDLPLVEKADQVIIPNHDSLTCQLANDMAPYFTTLEECTEDPYTEIQSICCVGAPAFTCSICLGEESVGNPDVFIPFQVNQTCDEADLNFFSGLVAGECTATKEEATPLDLAAVCGCEGAKSPGLCTLCGDLEFNKDTANVDLPDSGGLTCQTAFDLIPFANDESFCEETVPLLREECCIEANLQTAAPTAASTSAPVGGKTFLPTSTPGDTTTASPTSKLGKDPPPSTRPSDMPSSVPSFSLSPTSSPTTAPSLFPSRLPTSPPIALPTKSPVESKILSESTEFACSICPEDSVMEETNRSFSFMDNMTCTEVESRMLAPLDQSTCTFAKNQVPFDMALLCGCSNVTKSTGVDCELCVEGTSLIDNAEEVRLVNDALLPKTSLSCADIAMLLPFVNNEDFCTNEVSLIRLACCESDSSGAIAKTLSYGLFFLSQLSLLISMFM